MTQKDVPEKIVDLGNDDISKLSDVEKGIALERARQQFENRVQGGMRAYLASVELMEDNPEDIQEGLQELGSLVRSLGDECVGVTVQKRAKIIPATYCGSGKAEELRDSCREMKVDYVVFDRELGPTQIKNLEKLIERPVLDRTNVILQIFRKNAKSKEAKTQVEIAQLEYLAPRLSNSWIAYERQRGGGGSGGRVKGAGETQLELDKRRMRDKVASLKKELEKISKERQLQRKSRTDAFNVVLVGYTNAGKTTVMNGLTDSQLVAKDALFETLDSSVRVLKGSSLKILVTDTVGFIRDLPHGLVASFRGTLEETKFADLLLHVVDVSHPRFREHMQVTEDVLKDVGSLEVPRLIVFNKIDAVKNEPRLGSLLKKAYTESIALCASEHEDITRLRDKIIDYFSQNMVETTVSIPYEDSRRMAIVHTQTRVLHVDWENKEGHFRVRAPKEVISKYFETKIHEDDHE